MKMKKTIAAISAATVAVSAMAMNTSALFEGETTTDAAFEGKTLTFNLAQTIHNVPVGDSAATFTMKLPANTLAADLSTGAIFALYDVSYDATNHVKGDLIMTDIDPWKDNGKGGQASLEWSVSYYEKANPTLRHTDTYSTDKASANFDKDNRTFIQEYNPSTGLLETKNASHWSAKTDFADVATMLYVPADTFAPATELYATCTVEENYAPWDFVWKTAYNSMVRGAGLTAGVPLDAAATNFRTMKTTNETGSVVAIEATYVAAVNAAYVTDGALTVNTYLESVNKTSAVGSYVDRVYPMKSDVTGTTGLKQSLRTYLSTNSTVVTEYLTYADLFDYLSHGNLVPQDQTWKTYVPYLQPAAVVNDALANYDKVTVKFKTAKKNILFEGDGDAYYVDNDGTAQYKNFEQHLYYNDAQYNNTYTLNDYQDITGYSSYNYFNLFSGALVVNQGITMSLSDVNYFTYGSDFIAFEWDKVMTTNANSQLSYYAQYVQNMQLRTSTAWYWDSVDFVLENVEAEEVGAEAEIEGETEVIADDAEEIVADEEVPAEEVAVDEEVAPEVETEVEAVVEDAPVDNAQTGNASVALAVIPVALAAAAVVAKKRS